MVIGIFEVWKRNGWGSCSKSGGLEEEQTKERTKEEARGKK